MAYICNACKLMPGCIVDTQTDSPSAPHHCIYRQTEFASNWKKYKEPACPSMKPHSRTCRIDGQQCDTDEAYECPPEEEKE